MSDWIQVKGRVKTGYGVASGQAQNPRFPQGTIEMQKPFFRDLGLDLSAYFPGTINLSIAPCKYQIEQAKYTFKQVLNIDCSTSFSDTSTPLPFHHRH